ncbi:beta-lactamase family protein [Plantactinospora sp. S1510]|uniref:Beta-lactamase family protein n=1 Tax=Plantactinospora alkalitolerans TaxID=2789879 RepID=A0ABS0GWT5_9ACTN|nr:serine hydrolase domain-containing protein [Plantactinospora alkalitolerans]MBF9130652.1 beta-lactamase family protein [Plantactinospora alkalitolerans]
MVPGTASAKQEPDAAAIERAVSAYAGRAAYPGIAVTITKGSQVLYAGGYGHDSAGAAVTATTPMPAASVSKSFTALAVMQLVEAGKVTLESPVRDYLPDFRIADPRGAQITVRQLLDQTSGITDSTLPEKSLPQPDSLAGAATRARSATLAVEPGTRHFYTNTNYHLAARLVEVVAGEPFTDYLRRHVFEPIGMGATTTINQTPRDLPRDVRKGHVYAYGASIPAVEPKRFVNGSDGVISTASDMAKWLIVQSNAGLAANGTRLVSATSIASMHTSSDPRWTYGMGWDTDRKGRVNHSGIWFTYTADTLLLPDGYGIAVIGNSGIGLANEGISPLADELATLVTGGEPSTGAPVRLIVDLTLAGLTLLSLLLGIRNLRRARIWADRFATRPPWRLALRLLPRLTPLALLVVLPDLLGRIVGGGRDITFIQLCYYSIALVSWTAVAAVLNASVLTARIVALSRPRPARDAPATNTSPQLAAS